MQNKTQVPKKTASQRQREFVQRKLEVLLQDTTDLEKDEL